MGTLLTVPSPDEKWNPTHKYTLRGVVNEPNTIFQRICAPRGEQKVAPVDDTSTPGEDGWWKISYSAEGDAVEHTVSLHWYFAAAVAGIDYCFQPVTYETVMREACGVGSLAILVYATDNALGQEKLPLSDALKSFVKLDNRLFKQELLQSDRLGHSNSPDKKRSAVLGADSQSKRRQRSNSMDSMATNQASAGDLDDDMRDAPFDSDSLFGPVGDFAAEKTHGQDDLPDLVEIPPTTRESNVMPPPYGNDAELPPYGDDIEMETGECPALDPESARLAQVSLSSSPPKAPEMQERSTSVFLTRPSNGIAANASEPAALVGHDKNTNFGPQTNGI